MTGVVKESTAEQSPTATRRATLRRALEVDFWNLGAEVHHTGSESLATFSANPGIRYRLGSSSCSVEELGEAGDWVTAEELSYEDAWAVTSRARRRHAKTLLVRLAPWVALTTYASLELWFDVMPFGFWGWKCLLPFLAGAVLWLARIPFRSPAQVAIGASLVVAANALAISLLPPVDVWDLVFVVPWCAFALAGLFIFEGPRLAKFISTLWTRDPIKAASFRVERDSDESNPPGGWDARPS